MTLLDKLLLYMVFLNYTWGDGGIIVTVPILVCTYIHTYIVLKRIGQYCSKENFKPDIVGRVSFAAKSLCMWVRAMEVYGRVYRVVEPKKKKLEQANKQLAEKQATLHEAKEKLRELKEKLEQLQKQYEEKLATKDDLRKKAELTELRLDRAAKLVSGLAGERVRWEGSIKVVMLLYMSAPTEFYFCV